MTNNVNIETYLETLISEKGRDIDADLNKQGHINLTYRHLIDFIASVARDEDKKAIKEKLISIDFANGDVFHFLDYMVDGMIKAKNVDMS
jgi:hypothetical protein